MSKKDLRQYYQFLSAMSKQAILQKKAKGEVMIWLHWATKTFIAEGSQS